MSKSADTGGVRPVRRLLVWPILVVLLLAAVPIAIVLGIFRPAVVSRETLNQVMPAQSDFLGRLDSAESMAKEAFAPPSAGRAGAVGSSSTQRKVINTANLHLRVKSAPDAATELTRLAATAGGFVQTSNLSQGENGRTRSAWVILRVPADKFDSVIDAVKRLGEVMRCEVGGQDVTEEYTDLDARLKSWRSQESQYLKLLAQAETVAEMLAIEGELGRVREQIERLQGRLNYLDNQVDLATITATLSEGAGHTGPNWFLVELGKVGRALGESGLMLVRLLAVMLPWAALVWLVWRLGRTWSERRRRRNTEQ